jgi:RecB family exonuclease
MRTRNRYDPNKSKYFRLSRSRLENFCNCPRCFYIDRRLGVEPPGGPPFNINSTVDHLLKKEFDHYRELGQPHPYMTQAGLSAVPFKHERLDEWRENFKGVRYQHPDSMFELSGAIDDLWIDTTTNELIVVDYKATAKDGEVNINADWQISYKRQMEFYQWLLRMNGFKVSDIGYFVYCNGDRSQDSFGEKVLFKVKLIPYRGSDAWVAPTIMKAKACLDGEALPSPNPSCEQCDYLQDIKTLNI